MNGFDSELGFDVLDAAAGLEEIGLVHQCDRMTRVVVRPKKIARKESGNLCVFMMKDSTPMSI